MARELVQGWAKGHDNNKITPANYFDDTNKSGIRKEVGTIDHHDTIGKSD